MLNTNYDYVKSILDSNWFFFCVIWNITSPFVLQYIANSHIIPSMNDYLEQYSILDMSPPLLPDITYVTAYLIVLCNSIKFLK